MRLQFDKQWESDPGFVHYDFNDPSSVPAEMHHSFDLAVVDPPFITQEVWEKYTVTIKLLVKDGVDKDGGELGRRTVRHCWPCRSRRCSCCWRCGVLCVCVCVVACAVPAGKILCSTIQENADMMKGLLDVVPQAFMPSIPHLVYQYSMYANYPTTHMAKKNPEIPDDD